MNNENPIVTRNNDNSVSLLNYIDLRIEETKNAAGQRFDAQQLALKDALISQEKAVAAALDAAKENTSKSEASMDKRFDSLSEKIDGVNDTINRNTGAQGIYVTHADLSAEMEKLRISFESMLRPVKTFMDNQQGQQKGIDASWTKLVTIIGITATVITLLIKFI